MMAGAGIRRLLEPPASGKGSPGAVRWRNGVLPAFLLSALSIITAPPVAAGDLEFTPFVIGGSPVSEPDVPSWMSSVLWFQANGSQIRCGGTLIAEQWVMTAAHCLFGSSRTVSPVAQPEDVKVWFDFSDFNDLSGSSLLKTQVEQLIIHPEYRDRSGNYATDIALLKLAEPLTGRQTIPLAETNESETPNPSLSTFIIGYGVSDQTVEPNPSGKLMEADVELISRNLCRQRWGDSSLITEGMLCAGYLEPNDPFVGACFGDSGGPLFGWYPDGTETIRQFGIISFGVNPCGGDSNGKRIPGVYTNVFMFGQWINRWVLALEGAIENVPPLNITASHTTLVANACISSELELAYNGSYDRYVFDPVIRGHSNDLRFSLPDRSVPNRLVLTFTPPASARAGDQIELELTAFDNFGNVESVTVDILMGKGHCKGLLSNDRGGGGASWPFLLLALLGIMDFMRRRAAGERRHAQ
ncbi:MAG: serine protease [Aquisalimonadaceae bacterium]